MFKAATLASMTFVALLAGAVIGCDDTVSERKTVDTAPDGTTVTKKETVKQDDEKTTVKQSTDVDRPGLDGDGDKTEKKVTIDTDK